MKLFIGNLSFDTTEIELREILEPFEPILEIHRPRDRETGKPRGFAFVTLQDREKGDAAIEAMEGLEVGGRKLRVNEAEDRGGGPPPPMYRQNPENDITSGAAKAKDDRPVKKDGQRIRYKSI